MSTAAECQAGSGRRIQINGTELYVEDTGGQGEPILFSHGLLLDGSMFAPQFDALRSRYRCIAYDHRGQGRSADVQGDQIEVDTLCSDAVALIRALELDRVHFCGLSLGGFVALRLGIRYPELVRSLILISTSADAEPEENIPKYRFLNFIARWFGPQFVVDPVMPIMYGRTALANPARETERRQWRKQLGSNRKSIWRATNGVLNRAPVYDQLDKIAVPALIMVGEEDVATPLPKAQRIANAIYQSRLMTIARAGHTPTLEEPDAVNQVIADFLASVPQ